MKKLFLLSVIVCIGSACMASYDYVDSRSIYLTPPPDTLYNAAIGIVKDMGFTIIAEHNEALRGMEGNIGPTFRAEKIDKSSGDHTRVFLSFARKGVDSIVGIDVYQQHLNVADMEKLRDDIAARLRAAQK